MIEVRPSLGKPRRWPLPLALQDLQVYLVVGRVVVLRLLLGLLVPLVVEEVARHQRLKSKDFKERWQQQSGWFSIVKGGIRSIPLPKTHSGLIQ
jgi:hypothetical protein